MHDAIFHAELLLSNIPRVIVNYISFTSLIEFAESIRRWRPSERGGGSTNYLSQRVCSHISSCLSHAAHDDSVG